MGIMKWVLREITGRAHGGFAAAAGRGAARFFDGHPRVRAGSV